jgi:hypothetical protein
VHFRAHRFRQSAGAEGHALDVNVVSIYSGIRRSDQRMRETREDLNRRAGKYRGESKLWVAGKSVVDTSLVCLLAIFCPPLLIAYSVLWLVQLVSDDPIWKTTFSVIAGISLAAIGGRLLEAVLVVGLFSIDIVTGRFLHHWRRAGAHSA